MSASQPGPEEQPSSAPRSEVGGELTFDRSVFGAIAARVLRDIAHVTLIAGDLGTGFLGRLMTGGPVHPGITVEERDRTVVLHIEVIARDGVNFYDLGLDIQRRIAERVRQMTARPCVVNLSVRGASP